MALSINRKYTRSVNIERDVESRGVSNSYIPTARALHVFERFVKTITTDDTPRSWTLVGPYGSGKSSFGLFLSAILGESKSNKSVRARASLGTKNKGLATTFSKAVRGNTKGFITVLLTGSPEPFGVAFIKALKTAIERFWKRGKRPNFYSTLHALSDSPSTKEIMVVVTEIQDYLVTKKTDCKGILIVVDELGKFLEYEARHRKTDDIYLLQELAEHAFKGSVANLYLFTLTHQSFEQYAPGLNKTQQEEWAKIQGRFEIIPFVEPVEQTLEIVSKALDVPTPPSFHRKEVKRTYDILSDQGALPSSLKSKKAIDIFLKCYPLHPLTALFLPLLCQKVAQNERTLFSFIGSDEPFGLADCLRKQKDTELVYIHSIYDYFIENQTANILDHYTHRRWAEVTSALSRLANASPEEEEVLKTIGLINIIGSQGGVKASSEILSISTKLAPKALERTIATLKKKSLIQYRKFNNEYRVWQGSDFDIEEALVQETEQLRNISLSERLNKQRHIPNFIANRHSIRTGTFRFFTPHFVEASNNKLSKTEKPRILLYVAKRHESIDKIVDSIKQSPLDILGIYYQHEKFERAVLEVTALRQILSNRNELSSDPVAMHEFKDRYIVAKEQLNNLLQDLRLHPEKAKWFYGDKELKTDSKRQFNANISQVLSDAYHKSPVIKNELINQDVLSAQAATARNKLMQAMLTSERETRLGIVKYPAEMAIYKATLLATGIHQPKGTKWEFAPPPQENPFKMRKTWDRICEFLQETKDSHKPFTTLNETLMAQPYGIKEGVLPILYLAAFIYFKHEIALYENGNYLPILPPERYDIFIKRMDLFSVQLVKIDGINRALYERYADVFRIKEGNNLQALVKPFAQFISGVPNYVKNTRLISPKARDIVTAYDRAASPEDLLFNLLPKACGTKELTDASIQEFSVSFREGLVEIRDAYDVLLNNLQDEMATAFKTDSPNLKTLRNELRSKYKYLTKHVNGSSNISSTLRFIVATKGSNKDWLQKFFASLVNKHCSSWKDADTSRATTELKRIANYIIDIDRIYRDSASTEALTEGNSRVLLKTVSLGAEKYSTADLDSTSLKKTKNERTEILKILNKIGNNSLRLSALADIVNEVLKNENIDEQRES